VQFPQGVAVGRKDPEGGGEVVDQGTGGDGDTVEEGGFDRAFRHDEVDEQVDDEDLKGERKKGHGVVVESLPPVGRPVMESPKCVEQVVDAADDPPGQGGSPRHHLVIRGMPTEVVVAKGEKKPDEQGVQDCPRGPHASKTDDAQKLGAVEVWTEVFSGGRNRGGIHD